MAMRFLCSLVATLAFTAIDASPVLAVQPDLAPEQVPVTDPVNDPVTTEPIVSRPPITANDFFPEERDVTDCIGVLERPGCGNENRGGWRQFAVLGALTLGLVIVFGNIARGVRRNRR